MEKNLLSFSKYYLREKIGGGSFGEIYTAGTEKSMETYAVKLESCNSKSQQLLNESRVYKLLEGGVGIPRTRYFGTDGDHNALVMDLLGKSLQDLFISCDKKFSLKTTLMIADQMLIRLEYLHNKNLIHRDIKPENFVIGKGKQSNQIFMIDMGLSKRYCDVKTHKHNELSTVKSLIGTARYASINSHMGLEQSRRDDLESIAYVLIYLQKGSLPWQKVPAKEKKEKIKIIRQIKVETTPEQLCDGLKPQFEKFLKSVRSLEFDERPDYANYRKMFRELFVEEGFVYDFRWDWEPIRSNKTVTMSAKIVGSNTRFRDNKENNVMTVRTKRPVTVYRSRQVPTIARPSRNASKMQSRK